MRASDDSEMANNNIILCKMMRKKKTKGERQEKKRRLPNAMHKGEPLKTDTEIGIIMCCVEISG